MKWQLDPMVLYGYWLLEIHEGHLSSVPTQSAGEASQEWAKCGQQWGHQPGRGRPKKRRQTRQALARKEPRSKGESRIEQSVIFSECCSETRAILISRTPSFTSSNC